MVVCVFIHMYYVHMHTWIYVHTDTRVLSASPQQHLRHLLVARLCLVHRGTCPTRGSLLLLCGAPAEEARLGWKWHNTLMCFGTEGREGISALLFVQTLLFPSASTSNLSPISVLALRTSVHPPWSWLPSPTISHLAALPPLFFTFVWLFSLKYSFYLLSFLPRIPPPTPTPGWSSECWL